MSSESTVKDTVSSSSSTTCSSSKTLAEATSGQVQACKSPSNVSNAKFCGNANSDGLSIQSKVSKKSEHSVASCPTSSSTARLHNIDKMTVEELTELVSDLIQQNLDWKLNTVGLSLTSPETPSHLPSLANPIASVPSHAT